MSRTVALREARKLKKAIESFGVQTSIELRTGRDGTWYDNRFVGSLGHHIVSKRSQGLTPLLSLIKNGRSDLPGPLANCYGGWDLVARIICMEWANHPGVGGPLWTPSGIIPRNNGRPYLFGWEFEGGLLDKDWPPEYHQFMAACLAGTLVYLGKDEKSHWEHGNWAEGRKFDRRGYYNNLSRARREIREVLQGKRAVNDLEDKMLPLKYGDESEDVALVQMDLQDLGFKIDDDGKYGDETASAIAEMRRMAGTTVDPDGKTYNRFAHRQLRRLHFLVELKTATGDSNVRRSLERANRTHYMHLSDDVPADLRIPHLGSSESSTRLG
jgi:hypothetical protein